MNRILNFTCENCGIIYHHSLKAEAVRAEVCLSCAFKEIAVFTVTHPEQDITLETMKQVDEFIDLEIQESEGEIKREDLPIANHKMKVLEFYDLPEWQS